MSYQVILMEGPNEPWWFFDNWQDDIVWQEDFPNLSLARKCYRKKYQELVIKYAHLTEKANYQVAFWNDDEFYYCEDCADDLQLFHGLLITKDYEQVE